MKKSSKAALLSALIFPGVGHLVLKQYLRGSALVLVAFTAFSVAVDRAYQRALTVVDRILAGDVPADTGSIADMVSSSTSGADSVIDNAAVIVLVACWLFAIIDSHRLGAAQERQDPSMTGPGSHPR